MTYRIILLSAATVMLAVPAFAQSYTTRPTIYGQPEFGSTTERSDGVTYRTRPTIYGQPEFGSRTEGSDGSSCRTRPVIYGQPEFGSRTTCD